MDVPHNSHLDGSALGLAERAREATLSLYLRSAGFQGQGGIDSPAEVCQVLGSLRSLVENLVRSLPELSAWLEQQLLSGNLPHNGGTAFDDLTRSMRDATAALARARNVGEQLGRDLAMAHTASRGFVGSQPGRASGQP